MKNARMVYTRAIALCAGLLIVFSMVLLVSYVLTADNVAKLIPGPDRRITPTPVTVDVTGKAGLPLREIILGSGLTMTPRAIPTRRRATLEDVRSDWGITGQLSCSSITPSHTGWPLT